MLDPTVKPLSTLHIAHACGGMATCRTTFMVTKYTKEMIQHRYILLGAYKDYKIYIRRSGRRWIHLLEGYLVLRLTKI